MEHGVVGVDNRGGDSVNVVEIVEESRLVPVSVSWEN